MIVQKIKRQEPTTFDVAYKYYAVLFAINGMSLTEREIQLIAFIGVNGSISYKHVKEEFCNKFNTSIATINNMVSKLKNGNILIKEEGKIKLLPVIALDFNKDIVLQITLIHGGV
jgi:hypothetical protein